jgi:pyruvate formate-lyase activating enzyme-like uncharacterized protein
MDPKEMEAGSFFIGRLPRGCTLCRRGSKMVLLATGKCESGCFYCPLSQKKKGKEVVYANEKLVEKDEDVIKEAELIGAEGTGITGGDPLAVLDETVHYIEMLKARFGLKHHIHLYTSTIDRDAYLRLQEAGLDELRIHPALEDWDRLQGSGLEEAVKGLTMKVGLEIPAVPGEEERMEALVRFADSIDLDFVNLNELEFSETNCDKLLEKGFGVKDDISSAAKGSMEAAVRILSLDLQIPRHFCSSSFKDAIQLRKRMLRRAQRIARPGDVITKDGTLLKGIIETNDPGGMKDLLAKEYQVPDELMFVDTEKGRLEVAAWVLRDLDEIAPDLYVESYLIEEYPTADRLEVEREPIRTKEKKKKSGEKKTIRAA